MKKTSIASIALICLVALSVIYGFVTITAYHADNSRSYSPAPSEPSDNSRPYSSHPIIKLLDNSRPY